MDRQNNPDDKAENEDVFDDARYDDPSYDGLIDLCIREDCKQWKRAEFERRNKRVMR